MRRSSCSSNKERTAHFAELPDLFPENFLGHIEMLRKAGKAHKLDCAAVDQLFGQGAFIRDKGPAANMTDRRTADGLISVFRIIHGFLPACTGRASYHGREQPD